MLSDEWCRRLAGYDRWFLGLSGGLDSTILLHILSGLPDAQKKLTAVHCNHGLSQEADSWSEHCAQQCLSLGIPLIVEKLCFNAGSNIEEHARNARYVALAKLLKTNDACCVAHHADDQAETVLLHLMRGAGIEGLSAMSAERSLGLGTLARPLLEHSRQLLVDYAHAHQLTWVEDASNQELNFARNYVRHAVIPVLLKKWPHSVARLGVTAEHCQQASRHLSRLAAQDSESLIDKQINVAPLLNLSADRLQNVLRKWLINNRVRIPSVGWFQCLIGELVYAAGDAQPCLRTGPWLIRRYRHVLYLTEVHVEPSYSPCIWENFPAPLSLTPDGPYVYARPAKTGIYVPLGSVVQVKFRAGGEKVRWLSHSKTLKALFQEWGVPPWARNTVPLIYLDDCLVAVAGIDRDISQSGASGTIFSIHMANSMDLCTHTELE